MTMYFNKNWVGRDYECTNVVAVESPEPPTVGWSGGPADYWQAAPSGFLLPSGAQEIGGFGGMTFYGYL